jgi:hypothetical protein
MLLILFWLNIKRLIATYSVTELGLDEHSVSSQSATEVLGNGLGNRIF